MSARITVRTLRELCSAVAALLGVQLTGATVAAWAASQVANVGVTSGSSSCDYGSGTSNCPSSPSYAQCGGAGLVCGARVRTGAYPYLDGYVVWNGDNPSDPNVLVCYDGWTSGHNGNGYGVCTVPTPNSIT